MKDEIIPLCTDCTREPLVMEGLEFSACFTCPKFIEWELTIKESEELLKQLQAK